MRDLPLIFVVVAAGLALAGCSKQSQPAVPSTPPQSSAPAAPAATASAEAPASSTVGVSQDLARECQLRFGDASTAPKFEYDTDVLQSDDRSLLQQVAECLIHGPLKGRKVKLIGRADPRGTEQYNLGLGSRRAATVRSYLQRLGVPAQQLAQSTRGDLDAAGTEEAGWRTDRRVDLDLAN